MKDKKFLVRALMETDLVIEIEANSKEEVEDMILNDNGSIAGAMWEDGQGSWTWGEISEIKKEMNNEV